MSEKIVEQMVPPAPNNFTPCFDVMPGYGRFNLWSNEDYTEFFMTFYSTPDFAIPGAGVVLDEEDRSKWKPLLSIKLVDPRSADAWSDSFKNASQYIRKTQKSVENVPTGSWEPDPRD